MHKEISGPVAIANTFTTDSEIIALSNNIGYGLIASVFTQDINRALRVASALISGMGGVNILIAPVRCSWMSLLVAPSKVDWGESVEERR